MKTKKPKVKTEKIKKLKFDFPLTVEKITTNAKNKGRNIPKQILVYLLLQKSNSTIRIELAAEDAMNEFKQIFELYEQEFQTKQRKGSLKDGWRQYIFQCKQPKTVHTSEGCFIDLFMFCCIVRMQIDHVCIHLI
jgi:hypothetical protein